MVNSGFRLECFDLYQLKIETMKNLKQRFALIIGLLVAGVITISAQSFEGKATYQSARKMNGFAFKGEGMTPEMEEQIKQKMAKQFQKEYELTFNLNESIWKEVESLGGGPATASANGMMIQVASTGDGVTYKNTSEKLFMQETEVFGKAFLVKDELEPREWEMTQETKKIGQYTAYKAVFTDYRESMSMSFSSEDEENQMEKTIDTIRIEAWYTPEIPVSQGPTSYWGLPGLIMEISDGSMSYVCTKVTLNPEDKVKIKKPSKGKKVTRAELRAISEEKTQEMMKKYSNGGGDVHIKIGRG